MTYRLTEILRAVCAVTGEAPQDVRSKTRKGGPTIARQVLCYIARKWYSSPMIGDYVNRDHTTVLHARDKVADRTEKQIRDLAALCLRLLRGGGVFIERFRPASLRITKRFNPTIHVSRVGHRHVRAVLGAVL